jgi:putative membrane protein
MSTRFWRQGIPGAALALAVALGGCGDRRGAAKGGETGSAESTSAADTTAAGMAADTGSMAGAGALTDANIVALLDEANKADSASGAVAVSKGTSADVKAFGKLMMKDHHKLRAEGAQLALKEKINPAPLPNDPVALMALHEQNALQSAPKGAEFDRTYIQHEIAAHRAVLDLLDRSESATTNPKLKALIEKARPEVQEHLTKAEAILKKLTQSA